MFLHHPAATHAATLEHSTVHSTRTRLAVLGVATLGALGLSFGAAPPAFAHDVLVGQSFVTDGADGSTTGVVLHFNNEIMDIGAEIVVTAPSGASAALGEPEVSGRDVTQPLTQPLETDGTYDMVWRVVSSDGHPIQGELAFTVAADGSAEFVAIDDDQDHDHSHDHGDAVADDVADDASDQAQTPAEEGVVTTQESEGGLSTGAIIAIGAAILVVVGATGFILARRKRTGNSSNSTAPSNHADAGTDGGDAA